MGSTDQTQVSGSHSEHFTHWAHLPSPCYFSKAMQGRLYSESQFEGIVCHRGKGRTVTGAPAVETKAQYVSSARQEEKRGGCWCSAGFLSSPFTPSRTRTHGLVHPTFIVGLLSSGKLLWKHLTDICSGECLLGYSKSTQADREQEPSQGRPCKAMEAIVKALGFTKCKLESLPTCYLSELAFQVSF